MITILDFNPQCITYSQMNMIFNARLYYRRLTAWTRAYMMSQYYGIGSSEELFGRLYLESLDIGNMMELIFGHEAANRYSSLVSEFPIALRDLISAQLAGDAQAIQQNLDRLYVNTAQRASFLEAMNPYWSKTEYQDLFGSYIQHTIEEANAIASQDSNEDIKVYGELTALTDKMGDTFAQGIYDYVTTGQTAGNLAPEQCITYEQMDEIYNIRMFWVELVTWVRNYMLSRYKGIGNEQEVLARLREVPVDYANSLRKFFGENPAIDGLQQELNTFIDLLEAFITAQMQGNTNEIDRITQQLYQNADKRAAYVTSLNPFWNEGEWKTRLHNNIRATIDESTTLQTGDYAKNIDIFKNLLDQAEGTSNYFAQGLFNYLKFK